MEVSWRLKRMSQIEEIKKLYATAREYKIPKEPREGQKQAVISINPLSLDEMDMMDMKQDAPMNEVAKSITKLMARSMGVEQEDVKSVSFEFMKDIIDAIMDANNFDEQDMKKTGIKDFIAQKQKLIEEQKGNEQSTGQPQG